MSYVLSGVGLGKMVHLIRLTDGSGVYVGLDPCWMYWVDWFRVYIEYYFTTLTHGSGVYVGLDPWWMY